MEEAEAIGPEGAGLLARGHGQKRPRAGRAAAWSKGPGGGRARAEQIRASRHRQLGRVNERGRGASGKLGTVFRDRKHGRAASRNRAQFSSRLRGSAAPGFLVVGRGREPHNSARGHKSNDWYPNRDISKRPSEGPLRAGEPSRCQGIAALSRSGGAAGAAMARFYRIELRRLSFRRSAPSRLMRHLDGQMRQRREAGETAPIIVGLADRRRSVSVGTKLAPDCLAQTVIRYFVAAATDGYS